MLLHMLLTYYEVLVNIMCSLLLEMLDNLMTERNIQLRFVIGAQGPPAELKHEPK